MRAVHASVIVVLVLLTITTGCRRGETPEPATPGEATGAPDAGGRELLAPEPEPGVRFRLSDAEPAGPPAAERVPVAAAEQLPDEAVARLLARLPDLPESAAEEVAFAFKPGPKPPAVTGETVRQPFPPETQADGPPEVAAEPLEVARHQPEGDIDLASHMAVTFSQAMVSLTSHTALEASEVPVRIVPEPEGRWRWVGTQTLLFEPEVRFPMATEYEVEIPAGTRSATGNILDEAVRWTFRTPPPSVARFHPEDGPTDLEPLIFIAFDQRVDPEAVLAKMEVRAGGEQVTLRPAAVAEIETAEGVTDDMVPRLVESAGEGRWVAFRPARPLPTGANVRVTVGPGLPSAEGPRTTHEAESFTFDTYSPLAVDRLHCGGRGSADGTPTRPHISGCEPAEPWGIELNNPLDLTSFDPDAITVTPELPGRRVEAWGASIMLSGLSKGRTKYTVDLPASLRDVFGQALGKDTQVTFETGGARPALFASDHRMIVLDPAGEAALPVHSINNGKLRVRLYRVSPYDWPDFMAFADSFYRREQDRQPSPGEEVWSGDIRPGGERDALVTSAIDLTPALRDGLGQAVVVVEPGKWSPQDDNWQNRPVIHWVQVTRLGLDVFADGDTVLAWVTSLADGRPIADAQVTLEPEGERVVTDAGGLARLDAPGAPGDPELYRRRMMVARHGDDTAMLPAELSGGWYGHVWNEILTWYVFDDRGLYKPGEEVHVKGWLRRFDPGKHGDVAALGTDGTAISYRLYDSSGEEVLSGQVAVNEFGGFDGSFTLPEDVAIGSARLALEAGGTDLPTEGRSRHWEIRIAEFRRPEFEVTATAQEPFYFLGQRGVVTAQASYFAGGALPGADVEWFVRAEPTGFIPPGRDDFQFGTWRPWWVRGYAPYGETGAAEAHTGLTDATGQHRLAIDFEGVHPPSAVSFQAEATVMDVNRQAWTGSASFLVHPASHYVGLRANKWFGDPGESFEIETIVADLDGELVAGSPILMVAERLDWVFRGGEYVEDPVPVRDCRANSADEPVSCTFVFEEGGTYRVTAKISDPEGRANQSQLTLWVSGGRARPERGLEQQRVELIPDADEYEPGDTASILVQAPFAPAEGLLSVLRSGLIHTERISLDGPSTTLHIPIEEGHIPNVTVQLNLVGAAVRLGEGGVENADLPLRPAFASGSINLPVPPLVRTLDVEANPAEAVLEPGGATTIDVLVTDAEGAPVPDAEVALVVADEAVLALTAYEIPDPITTFYPPRGPDLSEGHQRIFVQLADPTSFLSTAAEGQAMRGASLDGMARAGHEMALAVEEMAEPEMPAAAFKAMPTAAPTLVQPEAEAPVVAERTDLNPLAAFEPSLRTDGEGRVSVKIDLPDNVTRYRITAVATDGAKRFGKGESVLTARLPLIVRPSAPRFLNFGDRLELPIVVQNQTNDEVQVDVVVRTVNLVLTEGAGRRVTVPADDRVEVRFPAAAEMPGTAVFQVGAFSDASADAQRVSLPVWTPATTEAFATYGEIDAGAVAQPVLRPPDVVEQFGGLELTTSATALSALTDAFLYLKDYPFECAEQISSRLVATVALKDVLAAFGAEGLPSEAEVDAAIDRDIGKLLALQNYDGGFGWWRWGEESSPFVTIHVAHALARAAEKGYAVDQIALDDVQTFLEDIDSHLDRYRVTGRSRLAVKAYALYALDILGYPQPAAARALFAESDELPVEALGWLLYVMSADPDSSDQVAEIRRQLNNRVSEEAGTAQFTVQYDEEGANLILASNRRADAIVLEALIVNQPDSDLIPKLVRGLLAHRTRGRWGSTQENAFVLLALDRYFRTYEAQTPDFVAQAWLGEGYLGEGTFRGRTPDRQLVEVPMAALPEGETADFVLAKDGPGRLYYRLGMRYAPTDLSLEPSEHGFSVERVYEAVDDPDDVVHTTDGSWRIRAGARVRVRLTMVAPARRYHVALVDPLPAGLEALNPELATTGSLPPDEGEDDVVGFQGGPFGPRGLEHWCCWWGWSWWRHEAFRDERVEVFSSLVPGGIYRYTYVARATTPGEFVVPPTKAEEMYHPETFGRSATDRVIVR